jgi:enoyl-CoA hydratase
MDYSKYQHLKITQDGPIVTVMLNRPESRNVIDGALHDELSTIFIDLDLDDSCDLVILTGAGKYFCGGGDLQFILDQHGNLPHAAHANRANRRIQTSLLDLEKPIISKVRGPAIGLGASLALVCDFCYASTDAVFADPHASVGLVAGDGGAVLWPQLIGFARARRYLLTGDSIKGAEAAEIGLITEAVVDAELDAVVDAMAKRLLAGPKYALRWTKASINAALKVTANPVIDRATAFESMSQFTEDNRIAAEAFLAKQQPRFTGR